MGDRQELRLEDLVSHSTTESNSRDRISRRAFIILLGTGVTNREDPVTSLETVFKERLGMKLDPVVSILDLRKPPTFKVTEEYREAVSRLLDSPCVLILRLCEPIIELLGELGASLHFSVVPSLRQRTSLWESRVLLDTTVEYIEMDIKREFRALANLVRSYKVETVFTMPASGKLADAWDYLLTKKQVGPSWRTVVNTEVG